MSGRLGAQPFEGREDRVDVERLLFFGAVQRRLGEHVRNALGDRVDLVGQSQTAQDLQAAEAQVARFRINEDLTALFDQQRDNTMFGEQRRGCQPGGAGADDQHRDMLDVQQRLPPYGTLVPTGV